MNNLSKNLHLVEKTHNRSSFYKYMTADVAEVVLKNNTLRWSSPLLFNDPFDVPRELAYGIKPSQIKEAIINYYLTLFRNPPSDISSLNSKTQFLVNKIKSASSDKLINEIEAELRGTLLEDIPDSVSLDNFRKHWKKIIPEMRMLCLCESYEKTSMWYHYADKYSGAVIEFICVEDIDAPWRIAEPVRYTDESHLVSTPDGWAKLLSMEQEKAIKILFDTSIYTKSTDWAYEHEWRISSFKAPYEKGYFSDYSFNRRLIGNIYFGPLMKESEKENLIKISKGYPDMKIYEASIDIGRKISFQRISS